MVENDVTFTESNGGHVTYGQSRGFPLNGALYNESGTSGNITIFLPPDHLNNHSHNGTDDYEDEISGQFTHSVEGYAVPFIFSLIFITGIIGNGMLIYTVLRNKNMRNTPNIFIVSLALGDFILILVSVPFTATIYTFTEWPYGETLCKFNEFLQTMSLGVSIFTLIALSGDRYTAIMDPMSIHKGNSQLRTILIACFIWLLSVALAIPDFLAAHIMYLEHRRGVMEICNTFPVTWGGWYPRFHAMWRFLVYFAIPMVIIGIFYCLMARVLVLTAKHMPGECKSGQGRKQMEARKKVAKMVLSFVLVFIVCWLPRHIYVLWYHYDPGLYNMFWHVFKIIGFCLCFLNSCINPLALYYLSNQFRRYYNNYLFCCCYPRDLNVTGVGRRAVTSNLGDHTTHTGAHVGYTGMRRNSNSLLTTGTGTTTAHLTTSRTTRDSKL